MSDSIFIDSNIFLYAFSTKDIRKQKIASSVIMQQAIISAQVINEVSNNLLKKLGFDNEEVKSFVEDCYARYAVVDFSQSIFIEAALLRERHTFSYYDSLIVSSALSPGSTILYSEDMQHGQKIYDRLTIVDPFIEG